MRRILLLIATLVLLPFATGQADYAIVNNSTSSQTAHDSLSIPFFLLDSAGNQVAIASGDSVHLIVWYPGGAVAFQDSGAYNDADITTQTRHGMSWYSWQAQVSDLDGTPTEGTYKYQFSVHDKTSAALWTPFNGSFQLYATSDFDKVMDSIGIPVGDTIQRAASTHSAADVWQATGGDSTLNAIDDANKGNFKANVSALALQTEVANLDGWNPSTGQVKADITAISGDAGAADSLEEACDGYDNAGLTLFERLAATLDTLQNHDDWVALQAELDGLIMYFGACDGCYQILYPRSGTANKDSVIVIDPSLGIDSLVGKIIFYHGTVPSVYDSSYFYIDFPW